MTEWNWIAANGDGTTCRMGLSEGSARRVAQTLADETGEPYWVSREGDDEGERIDPMPRRVEIRTLSGVWVGEGVVSEAGRVEDCAADIGEDVYRAIDAGIASGETSGTTRTVSGSYRWGVL